MSRRWQGVFLATLVCAALQLAAAGSASAVGEWYKQDQANAWLIGVDCPSATTCYAVGAGGVIRKTGDGGRHWQALKSGTTLELDGISCASASTCVAVGEAGTVMRTVDGGDTWSKRTLGSFGLI